MKIILDLVTAGLRKRIISTTGMSYGFDTKNNLFSLNVANFDEDFDIDTIEEFKINGAKLDLSTQYYRDIAKLRLNDTTERFDGIYIKIYFGAKIGMIIRGLKCNI